MTGCKRICYYIPPVHESLAESPYTFFVLRARLPQVLYSSSDFCSTLKIHCHGFHKPPYSAGCIEFNMAVLWCVLIGILCGTPAYTDREKRDRVPSNMHYLT